MCGYCTVAYYFKKMCTCQSAIKPQLSQNTHSNDVKGLLAVIRHQHLQRSSLVVCFLVEFLSFLTTLCLYCVLYVCIWRYSGVFFACRYLPLQSRLRCWVYPHFTVDQQCQRVIGALTNLSWHSYMDSCTCLAYRSKHANTNLWRVCKMWTRIEPQIVTWFSGCVT